MNDAPINPITEMRGTRTQTRFAYDVNQLLGLELLDSDKISLLERTSYAKKHKLGPDVFAVFALYAILLAERQGKPLAEPAKYLAELYAKYQAWVQAVSELALPLVFAALAKPPLSVCCTARTIHATPPAAIHPYGCLSNRHTYEWFRLLSVQGRGSWYGNYRRRSRVR